MATHPIRLMTITAAFSLMAAPVLAQSAPAASNPAASVPPSSQPSSSVPSAAGQAPPDTTGAAPSASTGANANASVPAQLSAGLSVKDNTGASIGQVASVDTDSKTGQKMATIKMGSDSFRLPADRLAVADGAATVNLTQAQIQAQLHPKK